MSRHRYGSRPERPGFPPEWYAIKTWRDLAETNAAFVRGEIAIAPYHLGPLEADSLPLVENLLALHDRGVVTVNGQAARHEIAYTAKTWPDPGGAMHGAWWYEIEQRPYLCFYVKKSDKSLAAVAHLFRDASLVVYALDRASGKWLEKSHAGAFPVTKGRHSKVRAGLSKVKMSETTSLRRHDDAESFRRFPNITRLLRDSYYVMVAGREYGEGDVEQAVLDACNAAGIR